MARIRFILVEGIAAGVFLLPMLIFLNRVRFHDRNRSLAYSAFALYLCIVWALVGLPNVFYVRFDVNLNLIPFAGIVRDLKNSLLNIALFLPLGFLLPILWNKFHRLRDTVVCGFCLSAAIELLQLLTLRATDINDLITNTLGAVLGWLLGRLTFKRSPAKQDAKDLPVLMGCVFAVMFLVQPLLSNLLWSLIYR